MTYDTEGKNCNKMTIHHFWTEQLATKLSYKWT